MSAVDWWLADGLVTLRRQVNERFPGRDIASDGSIGDRAHSNRDSDHNPASNGAVRAIDLDEDLRGASGEDLMMQLAEHLRRQAGAGREPRLKYLIYESRLCSLASGWRWGDYDGANPHDKHLHISVNARADHDGRAWDLPWKDTDDMPLTRDEIDKIAEATKAALLPNLKASADREWRAIRGVEELLGRPVANVEVDAAALAADIVDNLGLEVARQVVDEVVKRLAA